MSQHEQLENMVAGWALSAADADEGAVMRAHIQACLSCHEIANRLDRTVNSIPLAVDDAAPPARLRWRILAAAAFPRPAPAPDRPRGRMRSAASYKERFELHVFERIPAYAAAAAVVLALMIGVVTGDLVGHRPAGPIPGQVAQFTLSGEGALAGATAKVIDLKTDRFALVDFSGLPPLSPGKVYELWLTTSSSRADPAAVFVPDSNGTKVVIVNHTLAGYVMMAVTTEQGPDGSNIPSRQPQMSGILA